jgi:leucyl-tRNA synthetase
MNYVKILSILNPVIPHLTSECLIEVGYKKNIEWPLINEEFLEKKTTQIVVQIDGKKRGLVTCDKNIDEDKLLNVIKSENHYKKYLEDKEIIKVIYVKSRLINLLLK